MNDAIKTISLDDVSELMSDANTQTGTKALVYNPQYDRGEFEAARAAQNLDSAFASKPVSSFSQVGSMFGNIASGDGRRTMAFALILSILIGVMVIYFSQDLIRLYNTFADAAGIEHMPTSPVDADSEEGAASLVQPKAQAEKESGQKAENTKQAAATGANGENQAQPLREAGVIQAQSAPLVGRELTVDDLANPYWSLPNPMEVSPPTQSVSPQQLGSWRDALSHPYIYQRLLAVRNARNSRMLGTEEFFRMALNQSKFWVRMEALRGLIETGVAIDADTMSSGFSDTRSDLVRNYLRRFTRPSTPSDLYFLRLAVRVVDAKSRKLILAYLSEQWSPLHTLYFLAGSYDPSPEIKKLAMAYLSQHPANEEDKVNFQIALTKPAPAATEPPKAIEQNVAAPTTEITKDLKIEKISPDVRSEDVVFFGDDASETEEEEDTSSESDMKIDESDANTESDGFEDISGQAN